MIMYILIAIVAVSVFAGTFLFLNYNREAEKRRRMMQVIGAPSAGKKGKKADSQNQRRAEIAKKLKSGGTEDEHEDPDSEKKGASLKEMIMQAGLEITISQFWIFSFGLMVAMTLAAYIFGMSKLVVILVAISSLLGAPRLILKIMAKRRQKKFLAEFADALDSMQRLLKAGMPVSEAIKMVAREYTGPIGEEMGRIFDQQKIGVPLPEAVLHSAKRMPLPEMQMFATAVAIQTQTGSSLSEVLENLSSVIRARFRLKRKVQALSSEAKASAAIIGALPNVVGLGMYFINREYIEILFIDPTGKVLLGGAVFWMFCGVMVMRQMINFKI